MHWSKALFSNLKKSSYKYNFNVALLYQPVGIVVFVLQHVHHCGISYKLQQTSKQKHTKSDQEDEKLTLLPRAQWTEIIREKNSQILL